MLQPVPNEKQTKETDAVKAEIYIRGNIKIWQPMKHPGKFHQEGLGRGISTRYAGLPEIKWWVAKTSNKKWPNDEISGQYNV